MTYTDIPAVHYHSDGSGTPPDVDEVMVADNLSLCSACKKAWELIGINSIDTIFENEDYARMQDEEERLEKSGCYADSFDIFGR
jgi:bifunctional pyridoxal-dependent enzyme with beta-cystathionase and maltose regulon repressor activities